MRRYQFGWVLVTLLAVACTDDGGEDTTTGTTTTGWTSAGGTTSTSTGPEDADGDGHSSASDCDDTDPAVHPEADELCNEIDDDCDGAVDEAAVDATEWYPDTDEDGYGWDGVVRTDCEQPPGYAAVAGDCDNTDDTIHPDAVEVCDGADNDCDERIDDDDGDLVVDVAWYADADGDGRGDPDTTVASCAPPTGFVADDTDCDDTDGAISPDADEVCELTPPAVDNDCDGLIDDADDSLDLSSAAAWYRDGDGDGAGTDAKTAAACAQPSGYVAIDGDCDDADDTVAPSLPEICDPLVPLDNDCDGTIDEDAQGPTCAEACADELDNDLDGLTDCDDGDCRFEAECAPDTGTVFTP